MLEDKKKLKTAQSDWKKLNANHQMLDLLCTKKELDKEVEWFQETLIGLLNKHAKIIYITFYSKRWWNKKVSKARSAWAKYKRRFGSDENLKEEFKKAQNQ